MTRLKNKKFSFNKVVAGLTLVEVLLFLTYFDWFLYLFPIWIVLGGWWVMKNVKGAREKISASISVNIPALIGHAYLKGFLFFVVTFSF